MKKTTVNNITTTTTNANPTANNTEIAFQLAVHFIEQYNSYMAMILSEMASMIKTTGENLTLYEKGCMPITEKLVWEDEVLHFWNDFEKQIICITNGLYSGEEEEFEEEKFADWLIENIKKFMFMLQFFPRWVIEVKPHKKRIVDWFNLATN